MPKHWFGESDVSDDSSEDDMEDWTKVDRENKRKEKMRRQKEKRKERKAEVARKARHMAGLGPIKDRDIEIQMERTNDYEKAKVWAVKHHLAIHYMY